MSSDSMIPKAPSSSPITDIEHLGLDAGGHLLIKRALAHLPVGGRLGVKGTAPALAVHLRAWCRAPGPPAEFPEDGE
ncbi:MAG: ferritin-like domain-containing protein, partial [Candidatus Sericytochromatia bacterium]